MPEATEPPTMPEAMDNVSGLANGAWTGSDDSGKVNCGLLLPVESSVLGLVEVKQLLASCHTVEKHQHQYTNVINNKILSQHF